MNGRLSVPIPPRMQSLPRDPRGYPIPVIVLRDLQGRPHFTINDDRKVMHVVRERRCAICGDLLHRNIWMAGGPLSAFHPQGRYFDSPIHRDCGHYALRVCPYLAMPSYSRRIEAGTLKLENSPTSILVDNTVIPDRPAVFVFARTKDFSVRVTMGGASIHVQPVRPWLEVEFWRNGEQIAANIAKEAIRNDAVSGARYGELVLPN